MHGNAGNASSASNDMVMAMQPIVCLRSGAVEGVEALARFPHRPQTRPEHWFRAAEAAGASRGLELLAVHRALAAWPATRCYLSVNVSPRVLVSPELLLTVLEAAGPRVIHVEITEHTSIDDYRRALEAIDRLRAAGARIAVDDVGAGYASFRHVLKLRPDVIKLDRALVRGIHVDAARRALVRGIVALAGELSARLVAEGIENRADLATVRDLGADAGQGWHLGRPVVERTAWQSWCHGVAVDA